MCIVDLEKAFDKVLRKMLEMSKRKKGMPEVMVRSVKSMYEGAKTILRCQRSLRSKSGYTKDLCCHIYFYQRW